jgi:PilZ domain
MHHVERRGTPRQRTFLGARIQLNGGLSSLDCLIGNLASGGAKLVLSQTALVPNELVLHMPKHRQTLRARIKWRDADHCGVEFCPAAR